MQGEKKYLNGLINADDDFSFVAPNEMVNGQNIRFGSTDDGATGRFEKIKGNSLIFNGFDYVASETFTNRGSVEDEARNRIIFFAYHNDAANNHAIYAYDKQAATTYTVLKEDQVTGGLGIISTKYIDAARVWGDLLIWTTAIGEVKVINMEAGIKLNHVGYSTTVTPYTSPLKQEDISLIKRPCLFAPVVAKSYDASFVSNGISDESWQFSYVYEYADYMQSVVGMWSLLVPYNRKDDLFNNITIKLPLTEDIPQTAMRVKLLAKQLTSGTVNVVKIWDKEISSELAEINTHNAGSVDADRLSFTFYNDKVIEYYSNVLAAKIEDLVPIDVQSLDISNNRLFLANYKTGFTGKKDSSLTISAVTTDFSSTAPLTYSMFLLEAVYQSDYSSGVDIYFRGYYISTGTYFHLIQGHYASSTGGYPTVTAPTSPVTLETYSGITDANLLYNVYGAQIVISGITSTPAGTVSEGTASVSDLPFIFKSNSSRQVAVCFYDRFNRIIQAISKDVNTLRPSSTFGSISEPKTTGILCTLSNTSAIDQIPDDAYYYSFVISDNRITNNFIELKETTLKYGRKNTDGTYTINLTTTTGAEYLVVDIGSLSKNSIGYIFNDGDLCRIGVRMTPTGILVSKTLKIITQIGNVILCSFVDLGSLASPANQANFEIYTPYKQSSSEFFYEVANKYTITNPGEASRVYSQLTHTIPGDTPLIQRIDTSGALYLAEAMSNNDRFWQRMFMNSGRPLSVIKPRRINQYDYVSWSGQYFIGTQINGVNTFEINNNQSLSIEAGAVRKLQTTNRIQGEGGVMLAICERETLSLYVGSAQISDETQFNLLLKTDTVIGTVNGLRGSYGTKHPESVVEYRGNVYWFDVSNGAFVSYSVNGLFDISSYKYKRPATLLAARMRTHNLVATVTSFVDFIPGGVDVKHEEVLWSIPTTETAAPKGGLSDYTGINYPYDLYDGLSKTWVYKINADKWGCPHNYAAEGFVKLNNDLYSFSTGRPHLHNATTSYNSFYSSATPSFVSFTCNQDPSKVKNFKSVAVESNAEPLWLHMRTEFPNVQSTELVDGEFTDKEGVWYASLFRDRLSPNVTGTADVKMLKGDQMTGQFLLCRLEFSESGDQLNFRFANIYYDQSAGHKI